MSIDALLAANSADTSDAAAFRRLLSLWGMSLSNDRDPCGQAGKSGLACLEQRGSWAQVRALNRPAILTLTDDQGQRHRVVLSGLDDQFATLDLGEHTVRLPLDELSRDWFGEFTLVWKPKTARTRRLTVGMQGDEVRWLRRSLNALRGAAEILQTTMSMINSWRSPCKISSASTGSTPTGSPACRLKSCSIQPWPSPGRPC